MGVKSDFKQTEIGKLPIDWTLTEIGKVTTSFSGGTPNTSNPNFYGGDIPWITSGDLNNQRIRDVDGRITKEGLENSSAKITKQGTLLLALYGATAGVSAISEICGAINQAILAIEPLKIETEFLFQYLRFRKDFFIRTYTQGGQPNFSGAIVKSFLVPLPPTKTEQESIAEALSDADALIESLEKLIAKKRLVKQGTMQKLLTGKRRLPGFNEKWVKKRLGDTAILKARIGWQGLTTSEYLDSGEYFLVTGTEFNEGYIDWNNCHYVDESRYKQDKNIQLKVHDVLVTKDGTIGKVSLIKDLPSPATLNSGVFVIRPLEEAFWPEFFYYLLCSNMFTEFLNQLSAGSTINHLYQKDFVDFVYRTPGTIEEQAGIANVLSDMDGEIVMLVDKLSKARQIKKGMMQELLTGRIRLIDDKTKVKIC